MGKPYPGLPTSIVFANDIDPDAATCYNANLATRPGHAPCLCEDIRSINENSIPDFDILLAGFPCQPFSSAGSRRGVHDKNGRGTLFEQCEQIITAKCKANRRPKAFLFENVRGILSSKMPSGIPVPLEIANRMESLGYQVTTKLLCSSDFGVPQDRHRVFIIGTDRSLPPFDFNSAISFVRDRAIPSVALGTPEKLMLGSILQDLHAHSGAEHWPYTPATQSMIDLIGPCVAGAEALPLFQKTFQAQQMPQHYSIGKSWKNIPPERLPPRFQKNPRQPEKVPRPQFLPPIRTGRNKRYNHRRCAARELRHYAPIRK